ncbi:MAG TPA: hypothetical protein ENK11_04225 [Phycisphaerales bacterium]|nr:hypothetical protein [Phycisphaerales bacterium]
MLKFLRKYQLILLAVGGSLLMVVFLLQPVLESLTPDPNKRAVAMIGEQKITLGEQVRANVELDVLERFLPELLTLLHIDPDNKAAHWLLLKHEAERLGVMGVRQDGEDWIPELAYGLVISQVELARRQGQRFTADEVNQMIDATTKGLQQRRLSMMRGNRFLNSDTFDQIMSEARGVMRLRRLYDSAPRLSEQRAIRAMEDLATRVLTDQLVLGPELLLADIPEPTETELAEQLEKYKNTHPGDTTANEYGFGYLLPARIKLEWLVLDPRKIAESVTPDPVLVRRRWQEKGDGTPFDEARAELENQIKQETVTQIMSEADELIRGEILAAQRGLEKEGIYRKVPDDWAPPSYERIAENLINAIRDRHGITITMPTIIRRTDHWLTPAEIRQLPGIGGASFRAGNKRISTAGLPALVRGVGTDSTIPVQIGLPITDPVAADGDGAKYYITVLDARGESPPDGVDDIRDQLVRDVKSLKAFEQLKGRLDEYRRIAVEGGLIAVTDLFRKGDDDTPVRVRENIFVLKDGLTPATFTSFQDPRADDKVFRDAVFAAAEGVDPRAEPDSLPPEKATVAVALPATRVVALARVRAVVPPTIEDYRRFEAGLVSQETRRLISEAQNGDSPLDYKSMASRLGYVQLRKNGADSESEPQQDTTG